MKSRSDALPSIAGRPIKAFATVLACLLFSLTSGAPALSAQAERATTVGFELDALPYISGGYYGSLWLGIDHARFRGVVASTTLPSFAVEEGFDDAEVDAYALIVDYMPGDGFRRFWAGAGLEYWQNLIVHETSGDSAEWYNTVVTVGAGYVWKFAGDLYLNPSAAHLVVAGDTEIPVGGTVYEPGRFTPEVSLKIGWHF